MLTHGIFRNLQKDHSHAAWRSLSVFGLHLACIGPWLLCHAGCRRFASGLRLALAAVPCTLPSVCIWLWPPCHAGRRRFASGLHLALASVHSGRGCACVFFFFPEALRFGFPLVVGRRPTTFSSAPRPLRLLSASSPAPLRVLSASSPPPHSLGRRRHEILIFA